MPKVTVLMSGSRLGTNIGIVGFCSVVLIEGERRVLFDSAHVGRRTYLLAQLAAHGLTPRDIDAQVLSHAHWDHVQNAELFDHAPLIVHPDERRYAHHPHPNDWATPRWTGAILDLLRAEDAGEGDVLMPGCRVIELKGHSPGSIGLEVETDDGVCVLTGDAIHNAPVAVRGENPLVFWNAEQATASIRRVVGMDALIYPGHDEPFRIRDGKVTYHGEQRVMLTNVGPGMPGVSFTPDVPAGPSWIMPGIEEQRLR